MWIGWLYYSASSYSMFDERSEGVAKIFENTYLSGAAGGLVAFFLKPALLRTHKHVSYFDCLSLCNGVLSGLVSVSSGVNKFEPWAAICVGTIGAILYCLFCKYLEVRHIDDPTEGSAVHMVCGMWAILASGFFDSDYGVIYGDPAKGHYFGY